MSSTSVKPKILVVDDEPYNQKLMEAILVPMGYEVWLAQDGEEALQKVRDYSPDVILLDVMMPRLNGFEVARALKSDPVTKIIPVVMVTALNEVEDRVKAMDAGADDFIAKPVDKTEVRARVSSLLKVKAYNDYMRDQQQELEAQVARRTEQLRDAYEKIKKASLDTIYMLSLAAEYRDGATGAHIRRMSHFAVVVARKLKLDDDIVENIYYAAPMHDVGKIGIPDRILMKPSQLDAEEWEIMKQHSAIGAKILETSDAEFIRLAHTIALTHHEKWDGTGYPKGMKGPEIPIVGRLIAVVDVFDALISNRPYKPPLPIDSAFSIIREGSGSHFDPEVVAAFFAAEKEIISIKAQFENYKD